MEGEKKLSLSAGGVTDEQSKLIKSADDTTNSRRKQWVILAILSTFIYLTYCADSALCAFFTQLVHRKGIIFCCYDLSRFLRSRYIPKIGKWFGFA